MPFSMVWSDSSEQKYRGEGEKLSRTEGIIRGVRGLDLFLAEACGTQTLCGAQAHLDIWNLSGDEDVSLFFYI